MSQRFSAATTDLTQKISRQMTNRKSKSSNANKEYGDRNPLGKKPLKIKEKYKSWLNDIDADDLGTDDESMYD